MRQCPDTKAPASTCASLNQAAGSGNELTLRCPAADPFREVRTVVQALSLERQPSRRALGERIGDEFEQRARLVAVVAGAEVAEVGCDR